MKHALLLTPFAAMLLASCSDVDVETLSSNMGDPIGFLPAMGTQSRASEITNANISSIYVTSMMGDKPYFSSLKYTKGSDGYFTSSPEYYWPGDDNSTLEFYAYAPSQDEIGGDVTIDNTTKKLENFSVADSIADQVDFITAYSTGTRKNNEASGVPLTFDHRLSQIEIQAKSESPNFTFKIVGARIGRAQYMGTFDFGTNEWTLDDWHDTAVYTSSCDEVTLSATPVSVMGPSGNAMLLPQTLTPWSPTDDPDNVAREAYLSVLINITTADGTQLYPFPSDTKLDANGNKRKYAWASVPISGTWEQGKKYIYILDFTNGGGNVDPDDPFPGESVLGKPIKATVTVNDWVDTSYDIPMTSIVKNK